MDASARHLAFHGSLVLLIGLACGAPYGSAVNRNASPSKVNAWRVAHAALPIGAVLMFAVSALLSSLAVSGGVKWLISAALIVSSYAFCISLPLAAAVGHRGLSPGGPVSARVVFAGNLLGAWASVVAALSLSYAAFKSL